MTCMGFSWSGPFNSSRLVADLRFSHMYLDKEWAKGLRRLLASKTELDSIVDMNPFGQLFFNAMNSPCVTAAVNTQDEVDGDCLCVMSEAPSGFGELNTQQRREKVAEALRSVLGNLTKKKSAKV